MKYRYLLKITTKHFDLETEYENVSHFMADANHFFDAWDKIKETENIQSYEVVEVSTISREEL